MKPEGALLTSARGCDDAAPRRSSFSAHARCPCRACVRPPAPHRADGHARGWPGAPSSASACSALRHGTIRSGPVHRHFSPAYGSAPVPDLPWDHGAPGI